MQGLSKKKDELNVWESNNSLDLSVSLSVVVEQADEDDEKCKNWLLVAALIPPPSGGLLTSTALQSKD
jgi:hypothetical protein